MMNHYRLPSGECTEDVDEFLEAWQLLVKPIAEMTDTVLYGFGSGISLRSEKHRGLVELPVWFLEAFNQSYKKGD